MLTDQAPTAEYVSNVCSHPSRALASFSVEPAVIDQIEVVPFDRLTQQDCLLWETLRQSQPELLTPFFSFAFSAAVHRARGDVKVALLKSNGVIEGYLPFHRVRRTAYPVGRKFNDSHGLITRPETQVDWTEVLKTIQVDAFLVHALVGADRQRVPNNQVFGVTDSFACSLGSDSALALQRLCDEHRTMAKQMQKTRKMMREIGELKLQVDCHCERLLQQAIQLKRDHYRRTNILDLFHADWTRQLIHELFHQEEGSTRVMLSVLTAGDQVVATHVGLREGTTLHYWFPAYAIEFAKYSPGTALFLELVRNASTHQIETIDMGFGEQPYKTKQTDVRTDVAFGIITDSALRRGMYQAELTTTRWIKALPMKESLKKVLRKVYPNAGGHKFD